jgi:hypothetical protein
LRDCGRGCGPESWLAAGVKQIFNNRKSELAMQQVYFKMAASY